MTHQAIPIPTEQSERWTSLERRSRVRYPSCLNTYCRITASLECEGSSGWIRDFSLNGLGLVLESRFTPGTMLSVELVNPKRRFRRKLRCRVTTHVVELANESWLHGVALSRELHADEVQALLP